MSRMGGMRSGFAGALGAAALALGAVSLAVAQAQGGSHAQAILSSGELLNEGSSTLAGGQLYREIDDPHNGDRWLLVRNEEFPGGPGRMVRVVAARNAAGGSFGLAGQTTGQPATETAPALPVIRPGDRLIVEEHTAVVDARLEARALMPAAVGAAFSARLMIGGQVVRVVALGPGRAVLEPVTGARP